MTAIVGILNKRAVAIAADSAVTVGRDEDHKIYNTAQKIFQLSKKQPVGIMVYSSAQFMGVPWDVLIKLYYDKSGDKDLPTVEAYREDFISFLKNSKYFTTEKDQQDALFSEMVDVVNSVFRTAKDRCYENEDKNIDELPIAEQTAYYNQVVADLKSMCIDDGVCEGFERYTIDQFQKYACPVFDKLYEAMKEDAIPKEGIDWEEVIFEYLRSKHFWNYSGLVFIGYGSEQIYPALAPILINIAFDGHLRALTETESDVEISNDNDAEIRSFAQDDVIRTLLRGLAPAVRNKYEDCISDKINEVKDSASKIAQKGKCTKNALKDINSISEDDAVMDIRSKVNDFIGDEYLHGLFRSIASFNVPDMASMAESLIEVTNLQRHITSAEESVGGPVDVAVITRSEGFVWMQHKSWLNKEQTTR